jgi:glycosyltransferase involved in cell wall biosynthesis
VVLVQFPWLFETCRRASPGSRLVLSTHNVETEKFAEWAQAAGQPLTRSLWLRYIERAEAGAVAQAALVIAVSATDREAFIERFGADPSRVVVVPNGADTEAIAPADAGQRREARRRLGLEGPVALFVGSNVPPNRAGLEWVRRLAAAVPEVTFLVVGPVCPSGRRGNLVSCGVVDDLRPHLAAADVSLCPIEYGGGTKIKLLEALAAGLPAIVFAESTRGLDVFHREQVLVADKTEESLAAALREIVDDRRFAAALGAAGRRLAGERHAWSQSARLLEEALERIAHEGERAPAAALAQ